MQDETFWGRWRNRWRTKLEKTQEAGDLLQNRRVTLYLTKWKHWILYHLTRSVKLKPWPGGTKPYLWQPVIASQSSNKGCKSHRQLFHPDWGSSMHVAYWCSMLDDRLFLNLPFPPIPLNFPLRWFMSVKSKCMQWEWCLTYTHCWGMHIYTWFITLSYSECHNITHYKLMNTSWYIHSEVTTLHSWRIV